MLTVARLLVHSEDVPETARDALRAALAAPPEERDPLLLLAARTLFHETDLDCSDARELVGLTGGGC